MDEPITIRDEAPPGEAAPTVPEMTALGPTPGEASIEVIRGIFVHASSVQPHFDPKCQYCREGVVTWIEGGRRSRLLCDCAIRRVRAKIRTQQRENEAAARAARMATTDAHALEQAGKRIERLRAQLAKVDGELAEREAKLKEALAPLEKEMSGARVRQQAAFVDTLGAENERRRLSEEITLLRIRLEKAEAAVAVAYDAHKKATDELTPSQAAVDSLKAQHERSKRRRELQREKERLERRIRQALAHHPQLAPAQETEPCST